MLPDLLATLCVQVAWTDDVLQVLQGTRMLCRFMHVKSSHASCHGNAAGWNDG